MKFMVYKNRKNRTLLFVFLAILLSSGIIVFANSFTKSPQNNNMDTKNNNTDTDFITFGAVHLEVTDRNRSVDFWQNVIGMKLRKEEAGMIELGTDSQTLVVLYPVAKVPFQEGYSGLYHLAIHPPNEAEFASILARFIAKKIPISPTDHTGSKAIYLTDPDGITVEITLETPERMKGYYTERGRLEVMDSEGNIRRGNERLNIQEVLDKLPDDNIEKGLSDDTKIGHMHLYVSDIEASNAFYLKIGFQQNQYFPQFQMVDMNAGDGAFKHRIAFNTWQSKNRSQAPAGTAGMRHYILKFGTEERLQKAVLQFPDAVKQENGYLVSDPSGNKIILTLL